MIVPTGGVEGRFQGARSQGPEAGSHEGRKGAAARERGRGGRGGKCPNIEEQS